MGGVRYATAKPDACDDSFGRRTPEADGTPLGAGRSSLAFSQTLTGLPQGTYYYCAIASNESGKAFGEVLTAVVKTGGGSGGGCQVDPSGTGGSLAWLGVLLLLVAVRRRRTA